MKLKLTLIFIVGVCRISLSQDFSGQVYLLSKDYFEDKCEVYAGCDCCASDLFLLSKTRFRFVSLCIGGDTFYTGTYLIKNNKLTLIFDKKYLEERVSDDYKSAKYEIKHADIKDIEFDIEKCGQKFRLTHATNDDLKNGSRYPLREEKEKFNKLFVSKEWKQLTQAK